MKWLFKWLLRLFLLAVVLAVILFLSLDSILRLVVEHNIRAQTGMDAEIGRFHVGLLDPVIEIENFRLYNPTNFDGTLLLDIPEIHVEYDRTALKQHKIHITLMRFNLGELNIVRNEAGQTNLFSFARLKKAHHSQNLAEEFQRRTNLKFTGIDVLNLSIGTVKYIDLKDQRNDRAADINLQNFPLKNVKSENDLFGVGAYVALRGNNVFQVLGAPGTNGGKFDILHLLF